MSLAFAELEAHARSLPAEERAKLVEALIASLRQVRVGEIEAEWRKEISDRLAAYDRGEAQPFTAEDVFAEARHLAK